MTFDAELEAHRLVDHLRGAPASSWQDRERVIAQLAARAYAAGNASRPAPERGEAERLREALRRIAAPSDTHKVDPDGEHYHDCPPCIADAALATPASPGPVPTEETTTRGCCNRCDRCGWQLEGPDGESSGCRPGNCSQRPSMPMRVTCAGCGRLFVDPVSLASGPAIRELQEIREGKHTPASTPSPVGATGVAGITCSECGHLNASDAASCLHCGLGWRPGPDFCSECDCVAGNGQRGYHQGYVEFGGKCAFCPHDSPPVGPDKAGSDCERCTGLRGFTPNQLLYTHDTEHVPPTSASTAPLPEPACGFKACADLLRPAHDAHAPGEMPKWFRYGVHCVRCFRAKHAGSCAGASTEPGAGPRVPPERGDVWRTVRPVRQDVWTFTGESDGPGRYEAIGQTAGPVPGSFPLVSFTNGTLVFVRRGPSTIAASKGTQP